MYTKYGVTYPSGVAVSDSSEIWYIEAGGGKMWAATRVPDSSVMVVANGYRIGTINFADTNNFMYSPELLDFCKKNSLIDSSSTKLNFADTFGRGRENRYYDTRRVWRGITLLNPDSSLSPDSKNFPMFIQPDKPVSLKKLKTILRDNYEGTVFSSDSGGGGGGGGGN